MDRDPVSTAATAGTLQSGEALLSGRGVPVLAYRRAGLPWQPLVLFLPGAGHLARVAYGHPGCDRRDFLDHWLAEAGWGLLALSYPCGHPVFGVASPDLSMAAWVEAAAAIAVDAVRGTATPLMVVGWSMAGRCAPALAVALRARGIEPTCFVPLAASPAFRGLSSVAPATERFFPDGLWDTHGSPLGGTTRQAAWLMAIAAQGACLGRVPIAPEAYCTHYAAATPAALVGEPALWPPGRPGAPKAPEAQDWPAYPLLAPISPAGPADGRHALSDAATWGFINTQALLRRQVLPALDAGCALDAQGWSRLMALFVALPARLHRHVPGNHFCFLGETGAQVTAAALAQLFSEARAVRSELASLLPATRPASASIPTPGNPP